MHCFTTHPFLVLEGPDGAGKTTIREELRSLLEARAIRTAVVGQHSWLTPVVSRTIVEVREQRAHHPPSVIADAYFHDKRQHAAHNVAPMLARGWVIADRYILSDAVYQEALYGIPAEETLARHRRAGTLEPAVTVFIEVDELEAYRRITQRAKQTRHYERPVTLARISSIYRRVLFGTADSWRGKVVRFTNDRADVKRRVREELLPAIVAAALPTVGEGSSPVFDSSLRSQTAFDRVS